ncbi:hypothetical protein [Microbulbifer variabilis]|nr:hypothetical protein [Microbulbifer variabilis]
MQAIEERKEMGSEGINESVKKAQYKRNGAVFGPSPQMIHLSCGKGG